jgi:soluble lytic murein transglycosylase-like protein
VKDTIENYWQGPARTDLATSLRRAEAQGYTPFIVQTMREHALPPEFFYLALQESRFNTEAVGPETRWGIAKGMWQFIPTTAQQYGLRIGPRADARVVDPQDERHDFEASTRAAARYLQTIYSTKAQASGLLVIASYNWGEHRVVSKLERLPGPQGIPQGALEGIPENPEDRNYWRFLREYSERMPEETKDYVLKIFSAAVIGQNPQLFGFDFENPLQKYMEAPADPQAVS